MLALSLFTGAFPLAANAAEPIRVTSGSQLKDALSSVTNGGVISIDADITDAVSSSTISSSKSFTIEGNGHKITQASNERAPIRISASGTTITVKNLAFDGNGYSSNLSYGGGAIASYRGAIVVDNCIFENYYSSGGNYGGGAILAQNSSSSVTVSNSSFINNRSNYHGGAIYTGGRSTITNSTFYGNSSTRDGGAIYANSGGTIVNCTIVGNTSTRDGGGVRNNSSSSGSQTQLRNNIVIGNNCGSSYSGKDIYRANDQGYNLIGDAVSLSVTNTNTKTNVANTGWLDTGAPKDNGGIPDKLPLQPTIALIPTADSPAINTGSSATVNSVSIPTTDQRGYTRIGAPDIGAYEYSLIEAEVSIMLGEVLNLASVSPLAAGMFETVQCSDGWQNIIVFDSDSNEFMKAIGVGEVTIDGYVGASKYIEIILTVVDSQTPDTVASFQITDCPEAADSEVWFDVSYEMDITGAATKDVEIDIRQSDGSPLPEHVTAMTPIFREDNSIGLMLVNDPANGVYSDIELQVTVKSVFDFTYRETKILLLKKPADVAVIGVNLESDRLSISSEGSIALEYNVLSLGEAAENPSLIWSYSASSGIALQGLTQDMSTQAQSGVLNIDIKNRSSSSGAITITATSADNPYRSASVTISVLGISNDVYSYDELYQAVQRAQSGDVISIQADLTAKKVIQVDGTSSASISRADKSLQSTITLRTDIVIEGNGHTIDGQGYYAIFYGTGGVATIKNLTITNAVNTNTSSSEKQGVAICLKGGSVVLENVTVFNCETAVGYGGALYLHEGSSATLLNCTIANNKGKRGGGIYVDNGSLVLENTIITNNRADDYGDNLCYTNNSKNIDVLDGGYNIIYDIFYYGSSSSNRTDVTDSFNYNENNTTQNKNTIDVYGHEWIAKTLGSNGGNAKTLALLYHQDSPAIDKIPQGSSPEYDQRGIQREGLGDIGAYEYYGIEKEYTLSAGQQIFVDNDFTENGNALLVLDSIKTWASSVRSVATVSGGHITAHTEGVSVITGQDGSGSVVAVFPIYVGDQSISGVHLSTEKKVYESGEQASLVFTVKAGSSTDKGLVFKAELFTKDAWVQLSELPEEITITGLIGTADSAGVMPLTIVNRWNQDAVIRITATSTANNSIAGTVDITSKREIFNGITITPDENTLTSGQPLTLSYVVDASPSYPAKLQWSFTGTDVVIPDSINTDERSGNFTLYPVCLSGTDAGLLTITATLVETDEANSTSVSVSPAFASDAVSSASIVNLSELDANQPFELDREITVYYALTDDISSGYKWEILQCTPDDHDDEFALTFPVKVTVDGLDIGEYSAPFVTNATLGSIIITVPEPLEGDFMLVLKGASAAYDDQAPSPVKTGYHFAISAETYVAATGISLSSQSLALSPGNSASLVATVSPNDASNKAVSYESSNTAVATVNENGVVSAIANGSALITAKTQDGEFTATCTVTVSSGASGNTGGSGLDNPKIPKPVDPPKDYTLAFTDVKKTDWFYHSVKYVYENGLFNGTSDTTFSPNATMTRGMMVTVLYRLAGVSTSGNAVFTDVPETAWYADAVNWAAEKGIVNGIGGGLFAPDTEITREQMAVILYNYSKAMNVKLPPTREASEFADAASIGEWATEAVNAMYQASVINGKENNVFDPQGKATRAEVATMLMNYLEAVK